MNVEVGQVGEGSTTTAFVKVILIRIQGFRRTFRLGVGRQSEPTKPTLPSLSPRRGPALSAPNVGVGVALIDDESIPGGGSR